MKINWRKVSAVFACFLMTLSAIGFAMGSEKITDLPSGFESFEQWKQSVLNANSEDKFLAVSTSNYFGICEKQCTDLIFSGDCNPCRSGEIPSMCSWHPDSMSVFDYWDSSNQYCNDWLKPYPYYNKQCYCSVPSVECSGGADPGDRKCESNSIFQCNDIGSWEIVSNCEFGCLSGACEEQRCIDHSEKRCEINSIYWFDSCGNRQEEYERCDSNEVCQNSECVKVCDESFIGGKLCSGNDIVQQYQLTDCSTEIRTIETCENGCSNSQCESPECPECPSSSEFSNCENNKMSRTNYKCDLSTSFECVSFLEDQTCECSKSFQCQYDEECEDNICKELECEEGEIADNNECFGKSTISPVMIGIIIAFIIAILLLVVLIFVVIKLKGGSKNGKR